MSDIHNPDRSSTVPASRNEITWDNTLIYNGNPAGAWAEIDGKVGQAVLILRIQAQNDGSAATIQFRKRGTSIATSSGSIVASQYDSAIAEQVGYAFVPTDPVGYIEIKANTHLGANCSVFRIGYIKPAMPRTTWHGAAAPATWADLTLGPKNAVCVVRLTRPAGAGAQYAGFRQNGETATEQTAGYDAGAYLPWDVGVDAYAVVLTDDAGIIEWQGGFGYEYLLTLEAYIPAKEIGGGTIINGAIPGAWADVTTTFGRCLVLARSVGDHATAWSKWRENGATLDSGNICGMMELFCGNTTFSMALLLFDNQGINEWQQAGGGAHSNTVTSLARLT